MSFILQTLQASPELSYCDLMSDYILFQIFDSENMVTIWQVILHCCGMGSSSPPSWRASASLCQAGEFPLWAPLWLLYCLHSSSFITASCLRHRLHQGRPNICIISTFLAPVLQKLRAIFQRSAILHSRNLPEILGVYSFELKSLLSRTRESRAQRRNPILFLLSFLSHFFLFLLSFLSFSSFSPSSPQMTILHLLKELDLQMPLPRRE